MQRLALLASSDVVIADDIEFEAGLPNEDKQAGEVNHAQTEGQLGSDLQHHEFQLIIESLQKYNGKKKDVAEGLGISPRTLRYKLAKMRELGYQIPSRGEVK